jgi:chorismate dehydratase
MSAPLRLGSVPYLNARPLVAGLDRAPGVTLVEAPPAELARALRDGRLDAALASVVELLRAPAPGWIAGPAIASRGPVRSIRLYLRCAPEAVASLALDRSSRTAAALAQACFGEFFGTRPRVADCDPAAPLGDLDADAVLRIGDPALTTAANGRQVIDLGELWTARTGLPFVWAVWLLRPGAPAAAVREAVLAARERGLPLRDEQAARFAREHGLDAGECRDYLARRIRYELGPDERRGLQAFARLAHAHGLVDTAELPEASA